MTKSLLLLLAAAACAAAQVTLSTVQGGIVTATGAAYDFGPVALGNTATTVFRLTNTGAQAVYLTSLSLDGPVSPPPAYTPDFSVACALSPDLCGAAPTQQLPILINPTGTLDFTIQFEPFEVGSPSANMSIAAGNPISIILLGECVPGLTPLLNNQPLAFGQAVSFGNVQVGSSQTIKLMLANQSSGPLTVPAIPPLTGSDFSLAGAALSGPMVPAGSAAELDVIFTPSTAGPRLAVLTIGLQTFPLQGIGATPPPTNFPAPSVALKLATPASAEQGSLAVNLASASGSSGSGSVTLTFQPSATGVSDDPTVTFADGTRTAAFTVAPGASAGQFTGGSTVSFATGTTTGTLVFTATLGTQTAQASVVIRAAAIGIDAAVAQRDVACAPLELYCTTSNVELQVNGWDNTRTTSEIVFTFYDASGNAIAPGNITVDAGSAFQQYFAGSDLGGVFGLHALFPVNGDSNQVVAAEVQLINSAGTAQTARITF
ncbi:MAG TPA: choice-of-anchor D domain-containing protein [Bryobacteraceae bacterium]|nr:choice-of-anchor D domain-containing protein [Bryobacteraceae bacterium]